jgi:hypothetical protein
MRGAILHAPHDERCEGRPGRRSLKPLDQVAEGYRAMDERRTIKVLLRP